MCVCVCVHVHARIILSSPVHNPYPLMYSPRSPLGVVATKKKTSLKVISHDTAPTYGHKVPRPYHVGIPWFYISNIMVHV